MYYDGEGVPQDYTRAVEWARIAATQGNASAQFVLGLAYATGRGVPQDYVEAHKWLNVAASRNDGYAEIRDSIANMMTSAQIAEAQKLAREWSAGNSGSTTH